MYPEGVTVAETSAVPQFDAGIIWKAFEMAPAPDGTCGNLVWNYTTADMTAFEEAAELAVA
jgi:hypothetical protein